jgi:hypothetical protein
LDKVIQPYFSGLGDHLQWTTTAKRFSSLGYDVYLSDKATFRNKGIKSLCWDSNPYIKGISSDPANVGDAVVQYVNHRLGFIGNWEKQSGLDAPYSKYPEIYYAPKNIEGLQDYTLVDFSCVSLHEEYKAVAGKLKQKLPEDKFLVLAFQQDLNERKESAYQFSSEGYNSYFCYDVFDYCNAISSCKKLLCLFSGAAVMASALQRYRQFDVECFICDNYKTRNAEIQYLYFFDNIKYTWL